MSLDQQFNTINDKLQQLTRQYGRLARENERLKEELRIARQKEEAAQARIEEYEQQVSILKVSSGDWNERDKKEFEKKINQ